VTVASNLKSIGFVESGYSGDDMLFAEPSWVRLNPVGNHFYELVIALDSGAISVVVHASAIKITGESKLPANNR